MSASRMAILALAGTLLALFFALDGPAWLDPARLEAERAALQALVAAHPVAAPVLFALAYALATALSLPGAAVLSLAAGLLFGRWWGTALVVLAASGGALAAFLAARHLFADALRARLMARPTARRILAGFGRDAFHYLLFLRLVPLFPFWLVNLVPAFAPVSARTFLAATVLGIAPGSFVFVNLGQTLGQAAGTGVLPAGQTLLGLVLLGAFALVPVLYRRLRPTTPRTEKE